MATDETGHPRVQREQPWDICERSFKFAIRIIRMSKALPKDVAGIAIGRQVIRSGTSIGANIEESRAAHSRPDFIQKLNIARKEARETWYWLRLIRDSDLLPATKISGLITESEELVKIMTSVVKKSRMQKETK